MDLLLLLWGVTGVLFPTLQESFGIAPAVRCLSGILGLEIIYLILGGARHFVVHGGSSNRFIQKPKHVIQPPALHQQKLAVPAQSFGPVVVRCA